MAFSINTNIASLQAQDYLRVNQDFQQKTINRVTSGLRIVSSGDDAAGLAIANSFRSDRAVLSQGVRNANDALSTLQTIDGGLNNISQLLDRARTLAAQSATGTFTGDRNILNAEFTSVIGEIDRQAQVIGLNSGGTLATNLSVFIGGGRGDTNAQKITNGSVAVDLSTSTVDARSLKLKGFQAAGVDAANIGQIIANTTNTGSEVTSGKTDFYFRGPGFGDDNRVRVSVNLSGVTNADQLVESINSAISEAGSVGTDSATAFKNAGIKAKLVTDSSNNTNLVFESSGAAFQVAAGDRMSNALLGNQTSNVGADISYTVQGASNASSTGTTFGAARNVIVRVQGGSLTSAVDLTVAVTTSTTVDTALTSFSSLVAANSSLVAAGISVGTAAAGSAFTFTSKRGENFEVLAANDVSNVLGLGTAVTDVSTSGTSFDITSVTSGAIATGTGSQQLSVSVGGGSYQNISLTFSSTTSVSDIVAAVNNAVGASSTLQQAGLVATTTSSTTWTLSSNNGTYFRLSNVASGSGASFGFGSSTGGVTTTTSVATTSATTSAALNSGGASTSGLLGYSAIRSGNDDQVITLTAKDSSGTQQSLAIKLQGDSTAQHGRSIDEAIGYINDQLQAASSADLKKIVAVKERDTSGNEKIRFLSSLADFKVSVASNPGTSGVTTSQGSVVSSSTLSGGSNIDIANQANAESAVSALSAAVSVLGNVQAVIGRGQNQFNFALGLAQTQLNNLAASESRIRDADLASEAANLTRASILQQAGVAALAQANSAPQAVLSLLRG